MNITTLTDNNGKTYTLVRLAKTDDYIVVQAGITTGIYEYLPPKPKGDK